MCPAGRDETIEPAKPSFLEYFEQKEKEANIHNDGGGRPENNGDHRKLPAEGDLQLVSFFTVLLLHERTRTGSREIRLRVTHE